jgi:predicted AlkP superfamily pyrophosphatase or phosphodiesterase
MNDVVGTHDIVFITLDTLRYDAAQSAWEHGSLPTLSPYLGNHGWELRHTPGSFTFAAHSAFFAGFLPTPARPGIHSRLFASAFGGSTTTVPETFVFPEANLPAGLAARGYRTICIGGTGFFNLATALGQALPSLFQEAHWSPELGVAHPQSEKHQVALAVERIQDAGGQRVFLFINISAIHQPNWFYGAPSPPDTYNTHRAALVAVDSALPPLFAELRRRGPAFCIICSDHGEAYGEDGYQGHRLGHEVVWNVPYAEFLL